MSAIAWTIFVGFFPACLGLISQIIQAHDLGYQLLALALLLLCIDQARMAVVDLEQVAAVKQQVQDSRLDFFYKITVSTIGLELLGFYGAFLWLGWGVAIVLLSQVWFHLLAGIQLQPLAVPPIQAWGVPERLPVLVADGIGLLLVGLWMLQVAPLGMATGLLGMVVAYGCIKYGVRSQ